MAPYRETFSQAQYQAPTEIGTVRLVIEPRFIKIELGNQEWSIGNDEISVLTVGKRRTKKRSMLLGGSHLYMAKAWPTGEISLWVERKPFGAQRLLGLRPVVGMDQIAIAGWAKLERLAAQLKRALSPYMAGASAFEMGRGGHRKGRVAGGGDADHLGDKDVL